MTIALPVVGIWATSRPFGEPTCVQAKMIDRPLSPPLGTRRDRQLETTIRFPVDIAFSSPGSNPPSSHSGCGMASACTPPFNPPPPPSAPPILLWCPMKLHPAQTHVAGARHACAGRVKEARIFGNLACHQMQLGSAFDRAKNSSGAKPSSSRSADPRIPDPTRLRDLPSKVACESNKPSPFER